MSEYREELISPDGRTVTSTSPVETNNLLYGGGYRRASEANEDLDENATDEDTDESESARAHAPKSDVPKPPFVSDEPVTP